jgi:hypothetical protein
MKAKQVNEFEQGRDPYNTMGIGKYDPDYEFLKSKHGDKIELMEDIFDITGLLSLAADNDSLLVQSEIMNNHSIKFKKGKIFEWQPSFGWIESNAFRAGVTLTRWWVSDHSSIFKKLR